MESEEAFFLDHIEYLDFKNNTSSSSSTSGKGLGLLQDCRTRACVQHTQCPCMA